MTTAAGDALYDRLSDTVVRLLERYGAVLTLKRYATAFDAVTQKAVETQTASVSVNAVFTTMKEMPISLTRVGAGERVAVMDGTAGPRLRDRLVIPEAWTPTSGGIMPGALIGSDYTKQWAVLEVVTIAPHGEAIAYIVRVGK